ncbi:nucleotidyl transferase AbiEii/AbiGii toxin family protein [Sphingobium sp. SA2]|uniref:nucleotidyl transferase AbiEii/AbiGii toxin family protein n=1 Tax=Sphingobium sp. SA2 TaxID=1524832 RepID=UPI0028C1A6E3|nr:nucleotidyl transferase AbiEii/AbiGii toxin family protein [Sphingobium sp. SA2]MDT7532995.1 nucleotidyl transferase AbiEii/AbiGii toxin family protein [Sphingobium sp. SA2]
MTAERYLDQVALLLRTIPEIASEPDFALKGGTAINLFVRDLPRLSVDIDLVYLPVAEREASLNAVRDDLERIAQRLEARLGFKVERHLLVDGKRLLVHSGSTAIKVEVSPVLRGTVFPPEMRSVSPSVEERFGFAEMQVVSLPDLYAGKMAAALDRQHPRDLFDIHHLLAQEGIDDDLFRAFLIYLVSHPRPAHELLCPHRLDIAPQYNDEFAGMTVKVEALDTLLAARETLIGMVRQRAGTADSRRFLTSFLMLDPDWSAIGLSDQMAELPAVRWKLLNLQRLRDQNAEKFGAQVDLLERCLDHPMGIGDMHRQGEASAP